MAGNACMNCPDREVGCHSKCEKYLSWKAERDRVKKIWLEDAMSQYRIPRIKVRGRHMWKPYQ